MMFSELASIRADGAKQAALLLHSLAPADRAWVLSQLDAEQHRELQPLIAELDDMGLSSSLTASSREALARGRGEGGEIQPPNLLSRAADQAPADRATLTDVDYLKSIGPEEVIALARIWSVEQPELVAYALKIQSWPWYGALLEHLPVAQRARVQGAFDAMPSLSTDSKLAAAVAGRMRKCCAASGQDGTPSVPAVSKVGQNSGAVAQPLQAVLHGWKRWTAGLRREAP